MEEDDKDYCEKWIENGDEDGSAIEWMGDLKECTVSKCPFVVADEKYVENYGKLHPDFGGGANMTACKDVWATIDALEIFPRDFFKQCLDYMMFLIDLPVVDPSTGAASTEECELVNNWMLKGNKEYRGYRGWKWGGWRVGWTHYSGVGSYHRDNWEKILKDRCMNWFNEGSAKEWMELMMNCDS